MQLIKDFIAFLTGFRKFLMGILFMTVTLVLLIFGLVTGSEFISTNRDVVVAFMATNICAKMINTTKDWIKKKYGKRQETDEED